MSLIKIRDNKKPGHPPGFSYQLNLNNEILTKYSFATNIGSPYKMYVKIK